MFLETDSRSGKCLIWEVNDFRIGHYVWRMRRNLHASSQGHAFFVCLSLKYSLKFRFHSRFKFLFGVFHSGFSLWIFTASTVVRKNENSERKMNRFLIIENVSCLWIIKATKHSASCAYKDFLYTGSTTLTVIALTNCRNVQFFLTNKIISENFS
jgi:hypothetical protein